MPFLRLSILESLMSYVWLADVRALQKRVGLSMMSVENSGGGA